MGRMTRKSSVLEQLFSIVTTVDYGQDDQEKQCAGTAFQYSDYCKVWAG